MHEIETNTIDPATASPGAILKRCREYHGISLEEAEEATKIGANYLAALEDDQIGQFASLAYLKGFLRIYASYLGLNSDDMIRLYDKLYTAGGTGNDLHEQNRSTSNGPVAPRKKFPFQKLALPTILLMLILTTSAIINRTSGPSKPPAQQADIRPAAIPAPAIQQPHTSASQQRPVSKTDRPVQEKVPGDTSSSPLPAAQKAPEIPKGVIVRLKVIQGGSLTVTIDGTGSQVYELTAGDSIEWKADRTMTLELSNAGGVEAELNGKSIKSFGPVGKPAVVVLDSDGVR